MFLFQDNWCLINGGCWNLNERHPFNPCRVCQPWLSQWDFTSQSSLSIISSNRI